MKHVHFHFFEDPEGNDEVPEEIRAQFEAQVEAFHAAKPVVLLDTLREGGYAVRPPSEVGDAELPQEIMRLAEGLALLRVFLEGTDHLSDRALYERLVDDMLREEVVIFPKDPRGAMHLDLIGSGSEEDTDVYLRYYADDETRERWAKEFNVKLPPKEKLPYDRDRHLPQRVWSEEEPVEN